jgi:hypothetical protein
MSDSAVKRKPRRNHRSAKAAGSRMERGTADYLAATVDDRIDRMVKRGAKDVGDIGGLRFHGQKVAVECKDTATMKLPEWLREAEVERVNLGALAGLVVHKRVGVTAMGEQYVTMRLEDFASLMLGERVVNVAEIQFGKESP